MVATLTTVNGATEAVTLENGSYLLVETKAPAGYNMLAESFTITVGANGVSYTQGERSKEAQLDNGVYIIDVINKSGVSLPSTGGMGTTAFTAGGIALIALALFLLMKKRMAMND